MLDEKTKELIAVGASIAANCQSCLEYHAAEASRLGACDQDIAVAAAMGRLVQRGAQGKMEQLAATLLKGESAEAAGCGCS
ncbi:MAG: carboxymuconolactone decarboxylase family protein [Sterolibacteriaceae bacterium MAG5]|nr:carboxymuconolactone decarboxylase family protein [Candidatus Nitricoxidireducens bremensis]